MGKVECFLQGVVNDATSKDILISKLKALCNVAVDVPFSFKEYVLKSLPIQGTTQTELRVRCYDIFDEDSSTNTQFDSPPSTSLLPPPNKKRKLEKNRWTARSLGTPAVKTKSPINVRTVLEPEVSENILSFLELLGYKLDYEFVQQGHTYVADVNDRKYTVTISKAKKGTSDIDASVAGYSLVELSTTCSDEELNRAADEINQFADFLAPPVDLIKVLPAALKATQPAPPALGRTTTPDSKPVTKNTFTPGPGQSTLRQQQPPQRIP